MEEAPAVRMLRKAWGGTLAGVRTDALVEALAQVVSCSVRVAGGSSQDLYCWAVDRSIDL